MSQALEISFVRRVADVISELGYKVTVEPSRIPNRRMWKDDPASLVRGLKYKPDLLVEHNEKFVIVEIKTRVVLLGAVIKARQDADYFGAAVVLCLPDDVFTEIPGSVSEFADAQSVRICPLAEVGNALMDLLQ